MHLGFVNIVFLKILLTMVGHDLTSNRQLDKYLKNRRDFSSACYCNF